MRCVCYASGAIVYTQSGQFVHCCASECRWNVCIVETERKPAEYALKTHTTHFTISIIIAFIYFCHHRSCVQRRVSARGHPLSDNTHPHDVIRKWRVVENDLHILAYIEQLLHVDMHYIIRNGLGMHSLIIEKCASATKQIIFAITTYTYYISYRNVCAAFV